MLAQRLMPETTAVAGPRLDHDDPVDGPTRPVIIDQRVHHRTQVAALTGPGNGHMRPIAPAIDLPSTPAQPGRQVSLQLDQPLVGRFDTGPQHAAPGDGREGAATAEPRRGCRAGRGTTGHDAIEPLEAVG